MWPELCARRFVTSPVTQIDPTCFSSSDLTCAVNSETDKTLRVASVGNNSPKSHCDLDLLINFKIHQTTTAAPKQAKARHRTQIEIKACFARRHRRDTSKNKSSPQPRSPPCRP